MRRVHYSNNGHREDTVLIVNDTPEQLWLMDSLLSKAGYEVVTADDGLEAFDVAKGERPDLVISDVSMPRANGIELCRRIRQDSELRVRPRSCWLAPIDETRRVLLRGLNRGLMTIFEMPFDSTRLIAKVSRLWNNPSLKPTIVIWSSMPVTLFSRRT